MPLTEAQLQRFEHRLEEERARVKRDCGRALADQPGKYDRNRAGDLSVVPTRLAQRGADTYDGDVEISNAERMSCELEEIAAALDRLHDCPARYGMCEDTGRLSPFGRIEISPWARMWARAAE